MFCSAFYLYYTHIMQSHFAWKPSAIYIADGFLHLPKNSHRTSALHVTAFLNYSPFHPNQRSSETHFQTTFCHFAKQEFPPPSPQTSPEPVNSPYFNNFLEANHAPYPPAPPVLIPYRRTRTAVFSAGQSWCYPKNFCRALSGGGVRFGKLLGMAEAG